MKLTLELEADLRELIAIIDRQAAAALEDGPRPDPAEVDAVSKRLIARGFPVGDFVREAMIRKLGYDPEKKKYVRP